MNNTIIKHHSLSTCFSGLLALLLLQVNVLAQNKATTNKRSSGNWMIVWSPDNKYFATGGDDSILHIYSAKDHKVVSTYKSNSMIKGGSWHPGGKQLAIANMKGIQILDMTTGILSTIEGLKTGGRGIGWNYSGELLALADGFGVVQILDRKGKLIRSIKKHNNKSYLSIDWHPKKNILVTGSDEIILFDTSGQQLAFIKHREEQTGVLTVRWHPSGDFFASGDYGHHNEGKPTLLQYWSPDGKLIKTMKGSLSEYRNIKWNKKGTLLASASDALRVWDKNGKLISTSSAGYDLWGIDWSADGEKIITASFNDDIDLWTKKTKRIKKIK